METIEDDLLARSFGFIDRAHAADTQFLLGTTPRGCMSSPISPSDGRTRPPSVFCRWHARLDWVVGELLDKLDALGIADNTIVIFTTDNGAQQFSWPDGGTTPFRGEKGLGWEGGFRAPFLIRWPNHIPAGQVLNGIFALEDVVPTVMAAVGVPDVKEQLLQGYQSR